MRVVDVAKLTFRNRAGLELAAALDRPAGTVRGYALFAHCFTCTKNFSAVRRISRGLTDRGIAVLSFDFTGLGQSEGDFALSHFSSQTSDLIDAAQFMEQELGTPPIILVGHSLGGTAALYAARELPAVRGIATIGSPADPEHVISLFTSGTEELTHSDRAEVCIGGRPFMINRAFIENLRQFPPEKWLKELRTEVLLFHSPIDTIVSIQNAERIFMALHHPKSFVSLDHADHLLAKEEDARHVAAVIEGWAAKFVSAPESEAAADNETAIESDHQVATHIGKQLYKTTIRAGKHYLISDEPPSVGGADMGPDPFEYLSAALGACTAITMRMYADRKQLALDEVIVHLDNSKIQDAETGKKVDLFVRELEIHGDLTPAQRERMKQVADLCPVHKVLVKGARIETILRQ